MARCLAAAISHAPGLSGTPDCGHCSSAATRASCARSSATPTSRTIRANPAMSLGDSILQTASMARWVSVAVTATDHTIFDPPVQPQDLRCLRVVFRAEHLADFGFAFPAGPVLFVKFHEADRGFDGFLLCLELKLGIAADDFLGFGERT